MTRAALPRSRPLLLWLGAAGLVLLGCSSDDAERPATEDAGAGDRDAATDAGVDDAGPPGGPATCPPGVCNYQSQSGCADGQACRPAIDSAAARAVPSCDAVDGAGAAGTSCSSWNDCAAGTLCISGSCRSLCCGGDWSACAEDEGCYGTLSVMSATSDDVYPTGVGICLPTGNCDVFEPGSCGDAAQACHIVDARGRLGCVPRGTREAGERCVTASDCVQGTSCVGIGSELVCRPLCRATEGGAPGCAENERCVHYARHPAGVGECVPVP